MIPAEFIPDHKLHSPDHERAFITKTVKIRPNAGAFLDGYLHGLDLRHLSFYGHREMHPEERAEMRAFLVALRRKAA